LTNAASIVLGLQR